MQKSVVVRRNAFYFHAISYFNEFALTVQVTHKINSTQIRGFILTCLYFMSTRVAYFAKNVVIYFPFNSWLSFQRLCRLLWG